ncbi:68_t:CDS:1, partial [Funneliformis caledonium]
ITNTGILKSLYDQDTILSKDIGDKMPVITDLNDDNDVLPDNQPEIFTNR